MQAIGLRPMHKRPTAGQRLTVLMRDGSQLACHSTMVIAADKAGIIIYHGRNAIDERQAKGWWPMTPNVEHNRRPQGVRVDGPVGPHSGDGG